MWRAFELCKDAYFIEYTGCKKKAHEEDNIPTPSLTVDKILKFSLDKYTNQYLINNPVWGLSSKREVEFVALVAKVTPPEGNLNLTENIDKKQNPNAKYTRNGLPIVKQ